MISDLKEAILEIKEEQSDPEKTEKGWYVKMKRMAGDRERWRDLPEGRTPMMMMIYVLAALHI